MRNRRLWGFHEAVQGIETEGQVVRGSGGRYLVEESLGRGGAGEVFCAYDTQLNRRVAIKRLHQEEAANPEDAHKFLQEARHLAALQHPNIVTIYDFIEDGGDIVVVMELLKGRTLQEIAEVSPLIEKDFVAVMRQTLEGLVAAHALGMLHRDIKPGNIMITDLPSGTFQVKLLDFGMAKIAPEPSLQTTDQGGGLQGSIYTMSPEQFEGVPLDARSDLYSLGCVAYFALTGYYPFTGATVPEVICAHLHQQAAPLKTMRPDLPEALCGCVASMMALHPDQRPSSAVAALEKLGAASAARRAVERPSGRPVFKPAPPPLPAAPAKGKTVWVLGALVVILLLGAAGFFLQPGKPMPEENPPVQSQAHAAATLSPADRAGFLNHAGQLVSVQGRIDRSGENKSGTIRFLDFAGTNRGDVSLVFFVSAAPADFSRDRLAGYVGKTVRVTGEVSVYDGDPQIVVKSLAQLEEL